MTDNIFFSEKSKQNRPKFCVFILKDGRIRGKDMAPVVAAKMLHILKYGYSTHVQPGSTEDPFNQFQGLHPRLISPTLYLIKREISQFPLLFLSFSV